MTDRGTPPTVARLLLGILVVALLARVATALWLGDRMEVLDAGGTHDQVSYDMLAQRVATGHGFTFPTGWYPWVPANTPTSYYSGTMVLHLAAIYAVFGYHPILPRLLYAVMGVAIVFLVFRLGRRCFGDLAGLFAAALAALYAYLILYSATLLTETPFILFLLLALDRAYAVAERKTRVGLLALGMALAGCILFRMAVLPFLVFLYAWMIWRANKRGVLRPLWHWFIPAAMALLAIAPWTARNYLLYDRFMLLESQYGHVFWNANHVEQGTQFRGAWVAEIPAELRGLNEVDLTNALLRRGQEEVLRDPGRFLLLSLSRLKMFLTFWPTPDSSSISNLARVLSFGVTLPFMLAGIVLALRRRADALPLYVFLILHYAVYVSSWVMIRYRAPADTISLIFAGFALATLYRAVAARLERPRLPVLSGK